MRAGVVTGRPYLLPGGQGRRLIIRAAVRADYAPFEAHHYLPGHAPAARCWLAELDGVPAAWCSVLRAVGQPEGWRVHRLVVLPHARGQGVARLLLDWVAGQVVGPLSVRTRNVGFADALLSSGAGWRASRHNRDATTVDRRTGHGNTLARTALRPLGVTAGLRCQQCRTWFAAQRSSARFCSGRCRVAAHRERYARP